MADIDVVAENLAELLTNSVDMAAVFYDIFLNPQPMDINIQMFDDNNQLITVTIPNRAKDRITSYVGEGSPEGTVEAPIGSVYVDTLTSTVYYKVSGSDSYGWNAVISQSLMETFIRTYLEARGYITTSSLNTYLITHEYVDIPTLSTYLNENGYIRGKGLVDLPTLALNNKLMVVTDDETDFFKNVSFGNLITSSISSDADNELVRGSDSKLYVGTPDSGVTAGTYQYPQNLVVDSKGIITSLEQGVIEDPFPSQTGQEGKFLQTNGSSLSWEEIDPDYIQLASSGTINLTTNSINYITPTAAVTFVLPDVSGSDKLNQMLVQVNLSTVYSIDVGTSYYFNGKSPEMSANGLYNLIYEYDKNANVWVVGWMRKSQ